MEKKSQRINRRIEQIKNGGHLMSDEEMKTILTCACERDILRCIKQREGGKMGMTDWVELTIALKSFFPDSIILEAAKRVQKQHLTR